MKPSDLLDAFRRTLQKGIVSRMRETEGGPFVVKRGCAQSNGLSLEVQWNGELHYVTSISMLVGDEIMLEHEPLRRIVGGLKQLHKLDDLNVSIELLVELAEVLLCDISMRASSFGFAAE